jgi:peptidoglycan biosynthesis protein MviN/MurJ (putative lipid II flippase)/2-polyprenyl-3-methyl-5-hydroxy-6-metoxy-1,4-benzoquinol methylase
MSRAAASSGGAAAFYGVIVVAMELAVAHRFGTGSQAAIYQAANLVATVLQSMLSGGVILGAIVPIFMRLGGAGNKEASSFLANCMIAVIAMMTAVVLAMLVAAPVLPPIIAAGFGEEMRSELTSVIRTILPILVPHAIAFVLGSALLATGSISAVTALPTLVPLAGLASYPWWSQASGAATIAFAYVVGGWLMAAAAVLALRRSTTLASLRPCARAPEWKEFLGAFSSTALAHAAMAVLMVIAQSAAGHISMRAFASFSYATRPVLLGMAFMTTVITSVVLPTFSSLAMAENRAESLYHARKLLVVAFSATMVGSLIAVWLAEPIVGLTYRRGAFSQDDVVLVAGILKPFVMQAPFYVAGVICWRILNAFGQPRLLTLCSIGALTLGAVLIPISASMFGVEGVAAAHTAAIAAWAGALVLAARRCLGAPRREEPDVNSAESQANERKSTVAYWDENWRRASDPGNAKTPGGRDSYMWQRIDRALAKCFGEGDHKGQSLIEIGAGASQWLPYLRSRFGFAVAGLDYSEVGCERARKILEETATPGEIYKADMFDMPTSLSGKFDVVASFGLVEHFTDTSAAVGACASCAKAGGLVVTMIPNMHGLHGVLYRIFDRKVYETHVPLRLVDLIEAHKRAGLEVLHGEHLLGLPGVADRNRDEPVAIRKMVRTFVYHLSAFYWGLEARGIGVPENGITSPYMICVARKPITAGTPA